jgi:hypothetical protein
MAYQHADKRKGAQIVKTPAPDQVTNIRNPKGGYGTDGPQPSSVAPGMAVESMLASNLREAQADSEDVLSQVIAHGVSGRDDSIPADGNVQQRKISADAYPAAGNLKRQQGDLADVGKARLPSTLGASADDSAARRAAQLKVAQ